MYLKTQAQVFKNQNIQTEQFERRIAAFIETLQPGVSLFHITGFLELFSAHTVYSVV
jgi:hypothetical protein